MLFNLRDLNFPEQFAALRPAQEEAIEFVLTSQKRFVCIGAPPGVGKSALAWALGNILGGKTAILTADLGLQDQYNDDFAIAGLMDVRGRSNYQCWEGGNCETGLQLGCKERIGCPYAVAARSWWQSEIGVSSYAWWLAVTKMPNHGAANVNTLICDEAHLAGEWLSRSLDFYFSERELRACGFKNLKSIGEDFTEWMALAPDLIAATTAAYEKIKAWVQTLHPSAKAAAARDLKKAEDLVERANRVPRIDSSNWVITREEGNDDGRAWRFECIWPGKYREKLFQGIERVVLMSATLRPKTMQLLGIPSKEYDFKEWGRQFPAKNGPVIWLPTARVTSKISEEGTRKWLGRHVEIATARSDRKGLVHSKSYVRAMQIADHLKEAGFHVEKNGNDADSPNARQAFERHCRGPVDSILVSPSFSTGWNFAGKRAEYQIISKVPLLDMRSKLMQARRERDESYEDYMAAQELVQASGRVVRSEIDRGETFIIDDTLAWWYRKAEYFFPRWWRYRKEDKLPKALPLL